VAIWPTVMEGGFCDNEGTMAVDAKGAVQAAVRYLTEMYSNEEIADVLLEEIDTSKSGASWLVTLSFYRPKAPFAAGTLGQILGVDVSKRQYKVINVDKNTGEIHSMKMRARVSPDDAERP
jgi:hypothetical protein